MYLWSDGTWAKACRPQCAVLVHRAGSTSALVLGYLVSALEVGRTACGLSVCALSSLLRLLLLMGRISSCASRRNLCISSNTQPDASKVRDSLKAHKDCEAKHVSCEQLTCYQAAGQC